MRKSYRSTGKKCFQTLLLALVLLFTAVPAQAAPTQKPDESVPVYVGLYYGDSAAPTFNLQNVTGYGSGYRLGYFDSARNFVQLGYTDEIKISVLKTHNIYLAGDNTYTTSETSNGVVGCFHVQLPGEYYDFETAKAVAYGAGGFVAWVNGVYYVRVGSYTTSAAARDAAALIGGTFAETSSYGLSVTVTGTNRILFQFDDSGNGTGLGIRPGLDDSVKTQTWCKGNKYFGSFRYQRIDGDITLTNVVPMNDYINCVISREMSDSWPVEALKAQAVCARSYYATNMGRHNSANIDICSTVHCQAYYGTSRIGANTTRAAAETANQYLWHNGAIVQAFYAASNGGASENAENVWGKSYPYLKGVVDPYEPTLAGEISNYYWTKTFTGSELQRMLLESGRTGCGLITGITLTNTAMGNAYSITFHDANGRDWIIYREKCRTFLSVPSLRFGLEGGPGIPGEATASGQVSVNGGETLDFAGGMSVIDGNGNITVIHDVPYVLTGSGVTEQLSNVGLKSTCNVSVTSYGDGNGNFVFKGSGNGHNVGMSQNGAKAMARQGFGYQDILTFYYMGTNVG